jgi:hypothetical protein
MTQSLPDSTGFFCLSVCLMERFAPFVELSTHILIPEVIQ